MNGSEASTSRAAALPCSVSLSQRSTLNQRRKRGWCARLFGDVLVGDGANTDQDQVDEPGAVVAEVGDRFTSLPPCSMAVDS